MYNNPQEEDIYASGWYVRIKEQVYEFKNQINYDYPYNDPGVRRGFINVHPYAGLNLAE
jgi:hypothetical protein